MADRVVRVINPSQSVFVAVGNAGVPDASTPVQSNQSYEITRESLTNGKIVFPYVKDNPNDSPSVFVYNDAGTMVWASDVILREPSLVEVDLSGYEIVGTWLIRIA